MGIRLSRNVKLLGVAHTVVRVLHVMWAARDTAFRFSLDWFYSSVCTVVLANKSLLISVIF